MALTQGVGGSIPSGDANNFMETARMLERLKTLLGDKLDAYCVERAKWINRRIEDARIDALKVRIAGITAANRIAMDEHPSPSELYPDLAEICITADPEILREIANFLHDSADEIDKDADECREGGGAGSGHCHWRGGTTPDIIVAWDFYANGSSTIHEG